MKGLVQMTMDGITKEFSNTILMKGKSLVMDSVMEDTEKAHLVSVIFGDGGKGKEVNANQTELFGITRVTKPISLHKDLENCQLIASFSLEKDEGNDFVINEMGLKLSNGELFAATIIEDVKKTDKLRLSWNWILFF